MQPSRTGFGNNNQAMEGDLFLFFNLSQSIFMYFLIWNPFSAEFKISNSKCQCHITGWFKWWEFPLNDLECSSACDLLAVPAMSRHIPEETPSPGPGLGHYCQLLDTLVVGTIQDVPQQPAWIQLCERGWPVVSINAASSNAADTKGQTISHTRGKPPPAETVGLRV